VVAQVTQHRIRDRADAHLQRGAVLHQLGDVVADTTRHVVGRTDGKLEYRRLVLH
jgi:predicted proteasome-type protease